MKAPLLEVHDLSKRYVLRSGFLGRVRGTVSAVERVSFSVGAGETLALVGESGSGKTTTGRALLRLVEPDAGRAMYRPAGAGDPVDLFALSARDMRALRRELTIVFQDPTGSLNPRRTAFETLREVFAVHRIARGRELEDRVVGLFQKVGLGSELWHRYPHQLSGGERQRLGIARALATAPRLVVCDEAVSSLDVSIQAQILNLFSDLQSELGLAYLFIAHDLSVVRYLAHRVAVMHEGRIVETGPTAQVFDEPQHEYTRALLAAAV